MAENINMANFNTSAALTAGNHSPSSPNQSNRAPKAVSSPWTQIVRGESDPIAGVPLSPSSSSSSLSPLTAVIEPPVTSVVEEEGVENGSGGLNGNAGGKRPAWNKPTNGGAEFGSVMGAHMWPALSESARVSSKSSLDSPRASTDGSSSPSAVPVSQGSGSASLSSSSLKQVSNSANSNSSSTPNHTMPVRQRSIKRNNSNSASNGGLQQLPHQGPAIESPVNSPSPREHVQRSGFVSQPHSGVNDHPHPRNSFRHRNGGPHPRGDGSHHQNYGGRRNQDHGNQDWNGRSFNGRDGHMQPRVAPRLMRHPPPSLPPNTAPFIANPPVRPFGPPMGFPELASPVYIVSPPESLRGVQFVAPMPHMFFPAPEPPQDHQLHVKIVNQIDYYFSNENLIKDTYLRQNMDDQGWVPIKLIAGFNKVSLLTDNIQLILDVLRSSTVVEVQGDKVRKRVDWKRWIMPPSVQFPTMSGQDKLVARIQNISLDQGSANQSGARSQEDAHADGLSGRSSSGDFNNQIQQFGSSDGTADPAQGGPASNSN